MNAEETRLLRAYRRTGYAAGGAVARIGRRCPGVDAALRRLGGRQGGFVTAWNPWSRRMPAGWNRRMNRRLALFLRRLPAIQGVGGGRGWAEEHFLVAADPRRIVTLARTFRQRGIVVLRAGGKARIRLLEPPGVSSRSPGPHLPGPG